MGWIIFRFVLIGPALGSFVFAIVNGFHEFAIPYSAASIGALVHEAALAGLYGLVFAHLLAGVPAGAAGTIYWWVLKRYPKLNSQSLMRALAGGMIGLICASVFGAILPRHDPWVSYMPSWSISGAIAGACCALCIGRELANT